MTGCSERLLLPCYAMLPDARCWQKVGRQTKMRMEIDWNRWHEGEGEDDEEEEEDDERREEQGVETFTEEMMHQDTPLLVRAGFPW